MKYLLLILIICLVFFVLGLKSGRPAAPPSAVKPPPPPAPPQPPAPQDIVSCAHCGLHVPRAEAYPGRGGLFCSAEHRAAHEAGNAA